MENSTVFFVITHIHQQIYKYARPGSLFTTDQCLYYEQTEWVLVLQKTLVFTRRYRDLMSCLGKGGGKIRIFSIKLSIILTRELI